MYGTQKTTDQSDVEGAVSFYAQGYDAGGEAALVSDSAGLSGEVSAAAGDGSFYL